MNVKAYVMKVVGVAIISIICDMLLPSGKIKGTVRSVYSIIIIAVLMSPILKIFQADINVDMIIESQKTEINYEFLDYSNSVRENLTKKRVFDELEKNGYYGAEIELNTEEYEGLKKLKNISIKFKKSGINGNGEHINKTEVSEMVAELLNIDKGQVTVICE